MTISLYIDEQIPERSLFEQIATVTPFSADSFSPADLRSCDALIVRSVTSLGPDLLENTSVRFVGTATSGTDHIDLQWLASKGIQFADAAGSNAISVAEYVFSAIALASDQFALPIQKMTLGVIGYGHVGSLVCQIGASLGMMVIASDPPLEADGIDGPWRSLDEILQSSDVLTIHVPLTRGGPHSTIGLIGENELNLLKKRCVFINTARGGVINEHKLAELISAREQLLTFVDVWLDEPEIDMALARKCTVATPHIAGYSIESKRRAAKMMYESLRDWIQQCEKPISSHNVVSIGSQNAKLMHEGRNLPKSFIDLNQIALAFPIREISDRFKTMSSEIGSREAFDRVRKAQNQRMESGQL